jgi:cytochrome c553
MHPYRHVLATLLLLSVSSAWAEAPVGKIIFDSVCASCHGPNGEGNVQLKSPSIAGMPTWYVLRQLDNFRQDRRGFDPNDIEGQLMRTTVKALDNAQLQAAAAHVATLKRVPPQPTSTVDLARGRELFAERCMECHRYNGEGEFTFGSPPLMGLQDWYLSAQLMKFKDGKRGVDKTDPNGTKMAFASGFIEDQETLDSLVAYLMSMQAPTTGLPDPFVKSANRVDQASNSVQK